MLRCRVLNAKQYHKYLVAEVLLLFCQSKYMATRHCVRATVNIMAIIHFLLIGLVFA